VRPLRSNIFVPYNQRTNNVLDKSAPQSSNSAPPARWRVFRIVEFAGIGPGPFACMMLADMGAKW